MTFTHPEKLIYFQESITKDQVRSYYQVVSKWMFRYLMGRPLSLMRCPKGTGLRCFFQKHPHRLKFSSAIKIVSIQEKVKVAEYMILMDEKGFEEFVQIDSIEFHSWLAFYNRLLFPDQIVLDLDPDPLLPFENLIEGALHIKRFLEKMNLISFVKLSGKKGLHLHIPIDPVYPWPTVFNFSSKISQLLIQSSTLFLRQLPKVSRTNKVFVDYLRNSSGSTIVSPYSLRALTTSSVAMPIHWDHLEEVKSSNYYNHYRALEHCESRKSDPWEEFYLLKQRLPSIGL